MFGYITLRRQLKKSPSAEYRSYARKSKLRESFDSIMLGQFRFMRKNQ